MSGVSGGTIRNEYKEILSALEAVPISGSNQAVRKTGEYSYANVTLASDVTKSQVESVLTGEISSHSHTVSKSDVGLSEVDNVSDAGKPVSTATQTALDLKSNTSHNHSGVYEPIKGADDNFVTDAQLIVIGNTSGTNTGNQTTIAGITGTIAQFNTAITDGDLATGGGTATGTNTGDQTLPTDATIAITDVTTNNVSTSKHGWVPKVTNTSLFLKGDGTWASPPGGSEAFPIGSVFIAVVDTDPGTLLGYGTWSAIAAGKMLIGLDSGDTDFDTVEETGGAKTKTIAQANLPNISTGAGTSHNHTQDAHLHLIPDVRDATTGGSTTQIAKTADATSTTGTLINTANTTATNQAEAAHTHSLGGSGTALNVVNPYFVVYMWKRTA